MAGEHLRYGLLGPVRAHRGGTELDLGPRQRRALLARLLLADARPVPVRELCDALWRGDAPTGAASSVRAHVSRLRSVLDPDQPGRTSGLLVSEPTGYRLTFAPEELDLHRFEALVARGRSAITRGDLTGARAAADGALDLWRGRPLADLDDYDFAREEAARLVSLRQDAAELRAFLLLRTGQVEEALVAAERLVADAPLREASWALRVRALYRAGRAVEALQCLERFRRRLDEELGLEPSPAMKELHTAVLRHSDDLLGPAQPAATGAVGPTGPVKLSGSVQAAATGAAPVPSEPQPENRAARAQPEPAEHVPPATGRIDGHPLPPGGPASGAAFAPVARAVPGELPLVGREHELAALREAVAAAATGRTRWTIVSGAPGSGRTRLLAEAEREATAQGFTVVRCGGGGAHGSGEFDPAARLLEQLLGAPRGWAGVSRVSSQPDTLTTLLTALATRAGDAPLLCLVDDLDDAAESFAGLLRMLAGLLPQLPLAFAVAVDGRRTGAVDGLLADLSRQGALWVEPEPLSPAEVAQLLALRGDAHEADRAAELHRRSGGNPFLLSHLLALPADRRTGPSARVPAAVRSVVRARLARLDGTARAMLNCASLDELILDIPLLSAVCQLRPEAVLHRVDAALREGLLVWEPDTGSGGGSYRFSPLSREVVRDAMTPPERQRLHAALARELADRPGEDPLRLNAHRAAAGPLGPPGDRPRSGTDDRARHRADP
ncbi:BTAD domain-containing putative transcriptional regulator [Streptomyces bohaiensis]|uniref:BTAD domain-containing putative transcriptional regulator n=1 Tax=Streptomyces bohaiensis TaxID=1431344 RepID=UPI003B777483